MVKTLASTIKQLEDQGYEVKVIHPELFPSVPIPFYKAIRLALITPQVYKNIQKSIRDFSPDNLHIATEGPLGWAVRRIARKNQWNFTSSYHTQFPEYIEKMSFGLIPAKLSYYVFRRFHSMADTVMVTTLSMKEQLGRNGINNTEIWSRGVDTSIYKRNEGIYSDLQSKSGHLYESLKMAFYRTHERHNGVLSEYSSFDLLIQDIIERKIDVALYVGRVSQEKSIEDFLEVKYRVGDKKILKLIIGPGPNDSEVEKDHYLSKLQNKFPDALFVGGKQNQELMDHYSLGKVFVFPSRTDTFGNVIIEAMAMGMPVVAYNTTGPKDIIINGTTGVLVEKKSELGSAIQQALNIAPDQPLRSAKEEYQPQRALEQFKSYLIPM